MAAQCVHAQSSGSSVAAMEHARILAEIQRLSQPKSMLDFSANTAALTAAFVLTKDEAHAAKAEELLTAWLLAPETRLSPQPTQSSVELVPLAEVAVALRFLVDWLPREKLDGIHAWFRALADFLNTDHNAQLDRDRKDHRASAWLLLQSAIARSQRDEHGLDACRARFRKPTLRNQITADGTFPQELASEYPLRNTLFNFDLLCGACQLLASPFDPLWTYELQDGPGLRSVAAYLYPKIADPAQWNAVADADHFREVPLRRPALLFAGHAYDRPEYIELWRTLSTAVPRPLAASFPIREPLLWTTRAMHGL